MSSGNMKMIALVFVSLLISLAFTTCLNLFSKKNDDQEEKKEEEVSEDIVADDVEVIDETYVKLEKRLKAVESYVEGHQSGKEMNLTSLKLQRRLRAVEKLIRELNVTDQIFHGLNQRYLDVGHVLHKDDPDESKLLKRTELDNKVQAAEAFLRDVSVKRLDQSFGDLAYKVKMVESFTQDEANYKTLRTPFQERLEAIESATTEIKSAINVNTRIVELMKMLDSIKEAIEVLKTKSENTKVELNTVKGKITALSTAETPPSCDSLARYVPTLRIQSGRIFQLFPSNYVPVYVYCDLVSDGGRWTVFQRRRTGSINFVRNIWDYSGGFGTLHGDYWMGLEKLHSLTQGGNYELRIDLEDWDGKRAYAKYSSFSVGNTAGKYILHVGGYSGNAGDSLSYHNGMKFSAPGWDHDKNPSKSCADEFRSGWWFKSCLQSNLNGVYYGKNQHKSGNNGVAWFHYKRTFLYSFKFSEMKFRRKV